MWIIPKPQLFFYAKICQKNKRSCLNFSNNSLNWNLITKCHLYSWEYWEHSCQGKVFLWHFVGVQNCSFCEDVTIDCPWRTSFCIGHISRKLCRFLLMFSSCFISLGVLLSFSSIDYLLCLDPQILMPFHLTQMRFSLSTHLLMCLSGAANGPVEMCLTQITLPRWLPFLLESLTVNATVLLIWMLIYFFWR